MYRPQYDSAGKHRSPWKGMWLKYQFTLLCCFAGLVAVFFAYHSVSDGDFSFLMTLGSLFVLFAFGLLVAKVVLTGSASNISLKTLECYALVFAARLTSILFYEGYLPYDRSGDWFYQATEVSALVMVVGLIACVAGIFAPTYSRKRDEFVDLIPGFRVPSQLRVVQLALPALVLAIFLHPSLNNNFFTDTAWAFALYLEAVAMLPQVFVFHRMQKDALEMEPFEANFMFSIAIARTLHFIFWVSSYHELNDKHGDGVAKRYPGHTVVFAQVVNLLVMGDYILHHVLVARRAHLLPTSF